MFSWPFQCQQRVGLTGSSSYVHSNSRFASILGSLSPSENPQNIVCLVNLLLYTFYFPICHFPPHLYHCLRSMKVIRHWDRLLRKGCWASSFWNPKEYFLAICCCLVTESCLTLLRPHELYSLPDCSFHGISQARILEWVATSFSRGSSWPRDQTLVSCISRQILDCWTTREADPKEKKKKNLLYLTQ